MYVYLHTLFSQGVDIETVVQAYQPEPLVVVVGDHHLMMLSKHFLFLKTKLYVR